MTTLHISNVPESLFTRIKQIASAKQRSIDDEVVELLERAVRGEDDMRSQAEILEAIRRDRFTYEHNVNAPDSVTLLREDRER